MAGEHSTHAAIASRTSPDASSSITAHLKSLFLEQRDCAALGADAERLSDCLVLVVDDDVDVRRVRDDHVTMAAADPSAVRPVPRAAALSNELKSGWRPHGLGMRLGALWQ